jgi:S-adenosylmethionine:tRNA ribosyltransferase-isomerase
MKTHQLTHLIIETGIIIAPSYSFKMVQGLITNFHQPHSTLLLLVAALVGETWKEIYDYALTHDFRFLSYGDGCLLLPNG